MIPSSSSKSRIVQADQLQWETWLIFVGTTGGVAFIENHRNPTVQKEAIRPIESAQTTIPPRPYSHIPTHLPANPSNLRISGH